MSIKVVCAWCGKHMNGDKNAEEVSHGMCDKCYKEYEKQLEELEKERKK